jgi:hypothetical protein
MCCRLSAALSCVVVVGLMLACGGKPTGSTSTPPPSSVVKGNYPPPVSKFNGRTAEQWGRQALDLDFQTCQAACVALQELKDEAVPFLLEAMNHHRDRFGNLSECLGYCAGQVATVDLDFVADFLDEKYATKPSQTYVIQANALWIFKRAGPRAKAFLPKIREAKIPKDIEQLRAKAIESIEG